AKCAADTDPQRIVIGLPLGIWLARSPRAAKIIRPLTDDQLNITPPPDVNGLKKDPSLYNADFTGEKYRDIARVMGVKVE
ncbi:hypothetical protein O5269_28295, partial [Escherichia coli]|nr:hypothetical protein [Escherichia coli]